MTGLSTTGSISFGIAFVAGRKRVPNPAAGNTAFLITGSLQLADCSEFAVGMIYFFTFTMRVLILSTRGIFITSTLFSQSADTFEVSVSAGRTTEREKDPQ